MPCKALSCYSHPQHVPIFNGVRVHWHLHSLGAASKGSAGPWVGSGQAWRHLAAQGCGSQHHMHSLDTSYVICPLVQGQAQGSLDPDIRQAACAESCRDELNVSCSCQGCVLCCKLRGRQRADPAGRRCQWRDALQCSLSGGSFQCQRGHREGWLGRLCAKWAWKDSNCAHRRCSIHHANCGRSDGLNTS